MSQPVTLRPRWQRASRLVRFGEPGPPATWRAMVAAMALSAVLQAACAAWWWLHWPATLTGPG